MGKVGWERTGSRAPRRRRRGFSGGRRIRAIRFHGAGGGFGVGSALAFRSRGVGTGRPNGRKTPLSLRRLRSTRKPYSVGIGIRSRIIRPIRRSLLPLGQRVEAFALDLREESDWKEFSVGTSVGNQRLVRTETVRTEAVRLRILKSPAPPVLSELGLFLEPEEVRGNR